MNLYFSTAAIMMVNFMFEKIEYTQKRIKNLNDGMSAERIAFFLLTFVEYLFSNNLLI